MGSKIFVSFSGLYHKAIAQSGVLWSAWCRNQSQPERGFKLAATLGKETDDPEEVVEFLRKMTAEDIVKAQSAILTLEVKNFVFIFSNKLSKRIEISCSTGKILLLDSFRDQLRRDGGESRYAGVYRAITHESR